PPPPPPLFPYTTLFRSSRAGDCADFVGHRSIPPVKLYTNARQRRGYEARLAVAVTDAATGPARTSCWPAEHLEVARSEVWKFGLDRKSTRLNSSHVAIS